MTPARRSYQYRLCPNVGQEKALDWTLERCRELYNACLQERRDAYRMCGVSVSYRRQQDQLPDVKDVRSEYKHIGSQVLQDVTRRVDRAFAAFFRRVDEIKKLKARGIKTERKAGYPRFKSKYRYRSLTLTQAGWKLPSRDSGRLYIAGIGHLKMRWSRPVEGKIKTVTIKRDADQWYVTFSCEVDVDVPLTNTSFRRGSPGALALGGNAPL